MRFLPPGRHVPGGLHPNVIVTERFWSFLMSYMKTTAELNQRDRWGRGVRPASEAPRIWYHRGIAPSPRTTHTPPALEQQLTNHWNPLIIQCPNFRSQHLKESRDLGGRLSSPRVASADKLLMWKKSVALDFGKEITTKNHMVGRFKL